MPNYPDLSLGRTNTCVFLQRLCKCPDLSLSVTKLCVAAATFLVGLSYACMYGRYGEWLDAKLRWTSPSHHWGTRNGHMAVQIPSHLASHCADQRLLAEKPAFTALGHSRRPHEGALTSVKYHLLSESAGCVTAALKFPFAAHRMWMPACHGWTPAACAVPNWMLRSYA